MNDHSVSEQEAVEGFCEHGNKLSGSTNIGKFLNSCATGGFSRR
jgi:hypothetical protein